MLLWQYKKHMKYGPIIIYKKIGETPLAAMERVRMDHPEWVGLPMTYAGRLDPVAEGLILVLVGEDCKEKDKYLGLSKEYELTVLFGFETDTYDLLGKIMGVSIDPSNVNYEYFESTVKRFVGDIKQDYPPYSSKPVDGKPLFQIAREGGIPNIEIPSHVVHIEKIEVLDKKIVTKSELEKHIKSIVALVKGDFRQEDILSKWKESLADSKFPEFPLIKLRVTSSAGAYMRVIAHDIGEALGVHALAYHIKRTKIGEYTTDSTKQK